MLKYLKYDIKANIIQYLFMIIVGIILSFQLQQNILNLNTKYFALIAMAVPFLILTFIFYSINIFYRDIFTENRYLVMMTPQKKWKFILSKLIYVFLCIFVAIVLAITVNILLGPSPRNGLEAIIDKPSTFFITILKISYFFSTLVSIVYFSIILTKIMGLKNFVAILISGILLFLFFMMYSTLLEMVDFRIFFHSPLSKNYTVVEIPINNMTITYSENIIEMLGIIINTIINTITVFLGGKLLDKKFNG